MADTIAFELFARPPHAHRSFSSSYTTMAPRTWLVSALLLLALGADAASGDAYFEGDGTTYTLGQVSAGNCNFMAAAAAASVNYAAINDPQWDAMKSCGRCAEVSCSDGSCADKTATAVVYILDRCPECKHGDLDLSPTVFTKLTGSTPSRKKIKWRFVDCPVAGSIKYCLKGGSNAFWTAIQPANTIAGVASVAINGKTPTMVDSAYYYLLNGNSAVQTDLSSVKVTLTSVGGETVEETVALTAGACTDGKLQFAAGKGGSSGGSQQTTSAPATPTPTTHAPAATTAAPTHTPTPTAAAQTPEPPAAQEIGSDAEDRSAGSTSMPQPSTTSVTANQTSSTTSTDFRGLDSNAADEAGTVSAPDQSSSSIVAMLTPTPASSSTSSVAKDADGSDDGVSQANVRSDAGSGSTSPVLMVLLVAAAVAVVALVVVAAISKKKKLDDKRNDRDDAAMQRSFGNFHSPVRVNADIAAL